MSPLDENTPRYLSKGIALFEATEDELLPIRVIGIQVRHGGQKAQITSFARMSDVMMIFGPFPPSRGGLLSVVWSVAAVHPLLSVPRNGKHYCTWSSCGVPKTLRGSLNVMVVAGEGGRDGARGMRHTGV